MSPGNDFSPFEIHVDFKKAIEQFDKFTATNSRLEAQANKLTAVWERYNKVTERLYRNTTEFAGGLGKITKEVLDQEKGYAKLVVVLTRYANIFGDIQRNATAVVSQNQAHYESVRKVTSAYRDLAQARHDAFYRNISAATFGPGRNTPIEVRRPFSDPARQAEYEAKMAAQRRQQEAAFERQTAASDSVRDRQLYARIAQENAGYRNLNLLRDAAQNADRARAANLGYMPAARGSGPADFRNAIRGISGAGGGGRTPTQYIGFDPNSGNDPIRNPDLFSEQNFKHAAKIFITYRALGLLKDGFLDAAGAAKQLNQQIAEIQTISQKSSVSFDQFREQILGISSAFGIAAEDVAEGTYQAISNQVVKAADSMTFMGEAARFAVTTQSTLTESVELLSSALNSYELSADHAREVSASLFKAIELGRFRTKDIANSFGTVSVLAKQLGVPMDELNTALAAMTVNGVKVSNAMTFLRGLFTKMLNPTEEMKEFLTELGFANGQAALETLKLSGFLEKLTKEMDGSASKASELFSYVRAVQAAISLAGKDTEDFTRTLKEFGTQASYYSKATDIMLNESSAVELNRQLQKLRNTWVLFISESIQAFAKFSKLVGGVSNAVQLLGVVVGGVAIKWILFKSEIVNTTTQLSILDIKAKQTQLTLRGFGTAASLVTANVISFGISLATVGLASWINSLQEARQELEQLLSDGFGKAQESLNRKLKPSIDSVNEAFSEQGVKLAEVRTELTDLLEFQEKFAQQTKDKVLSALNEEIKANASLIEVYKSRYSKLEQLERDSIKKQIEGAEKLRRSRVEQQLAEGTPEQKIEILKTEIELNKARIAAATKRGDIDTVRSLTPLVRDDTKALSEFGVFGEAKDKSVLQESLERKRTRKLAELGQIDRALQFEKSPERIKVLQDRRAGVVAELGTVSTGITDLDSKRTAGTGVGQLNAVDAEAIANERIVAKSAVEQMETIKTSINFLERQNKALEDQIKIVEAVKTSSKDLSEGFQSIASVLKDGGLNGLLVDFRNALEGVVKVTTGVEFLDKSQRQSSTAKDAVSSVLSNATSVFLDPFKKNKDLALLLDSVTVRSGLNPSPLFNIAAKAERQTRQYKELIAKGVPESQAVQTFDFSPTEIAALQALKTGEKPSGLSDDDFVKIRAGLSILPEVSAGRGFGGLDMSSTGPSDMAKIFDKLVNREQLTQEEFEKLSKAFKDAGKDFNITIKDLNEGLKSASAAALSFAETLKAINTGSGTESEPGKAVGGYGGAGGIFHPGEFIVNRRQTQKYRGLLERMNNGNENFRVGQMGGIYGTRQIMADVDPFSTLLVNGQPTLGYPFAGVGDSPFSFSNQRTSPEYASLLTGIKRRLYENVQTYGGNLTDLPGIMLSLSGLAPSLDTRSFGRQNYDSRSSGYLDVGGITVNASQVSSQVDVSRIANQVLSALRREVSRQRGVY